VSESPLLVGTGVKLDAETAEEAEARVRDNLPGGYTEESAPWEEG
jgi:hypothetical protein